MAKHRARLQAGTKFFIRSDDTDGGGASPLPVSDVGSADNVTLSQSPDGSRPESAERVAHLLRNGWLVLQCLIADIGLGPELGDWELKNEKDGVVEPFSLELYQSGCYALYGPDGKLRDNRFRGLARKDVDWELLRYLWRRHKTSGSVTLPSKRFIGHRTALQMNKPELQCTWSD